jgi:dihydrofolate reductase
VTERLALIVAVARGGVIGNRGGLPWKIPEDLRHFKATTMGHAILMGRRTWESIGRPLPGRRNIVVSRTAALPGIEVVPSLEDGIALARGDDLPFVIGGARLYEAALPIATDIYLTEIDREVEGDTFFPSLHRPDWDELERRPGEERGVTFVRLARRPASR